MGTSVLRSLGPQESPPQTGPRSVQPYVHSEAACRRVTDRQPRYGNIDNSPHLMYSIRPKTFNRIQTDRILENLFGTNFKCFQLTGSSALIPIMRQRHLASVYRTTGLWQAEFTFIERKLNCRRRNLMNRVSSTTTTLFSAISRSHTCGHRIYLLIHPQH